MAPLPALRAPHLFASLIYQPAFHSAFGDTILLCCLHHWRAWQSSLFLRVEVHVSPAHKKLIKSLPAIKERKKHWLYLITAYLASLRLTRAVVNRD